MSVCSSIDNRNQRLNLKLKLNIHNWKYFTLQKENMSDSCVHANREKKEFFDWLAFPIHYNSYQVLPWSKLKLVKKTMGSNKWATEAGTTETCYKKAWADSKMRLNLKKSSVQTEDIITMGFIRNPLCVLLGVSVVALMIQSTQAEEGIILLIFP